LCRPPRHTPDFTVSVHPLAEPQDGDKPSNGLLGWIPFQAAMRNALSEHVLVVDPAREQRSLLQTCLETAGYRVSTADSGEPALRAFREGPADVVLLDVVAPGFEGFATCKRLRELPAGARAAIVCLTPRSDTATHARAIEAGADECLTKPLPDRELLLTIRSALRLKHLADELARERDRIRAERDAALTEQRLRDETIALVVHDMKNPLAGVISNAEYLVTSKGLGPDQKECAHDIMAASRRLHRLVMSLLDVNLREHGVLTPALANVDLSELIRQARHQCALSISDKSLACFVVGTEAPLRMQGDRDMLARLLANLLDNAARSSPHGGEIRIEVERQTEVVELLVTDHGPRFSPDYRARMFDAYLPADDALRRVRKTRGLGLASCRAIAEAHGGSIRCDDAVPEGSTLCVQLPMRART
jgi:two-component system sensor histidine kinase/response regulator